MSSPPQATLTVSLLPALANVTATFANISDYPSAQIMAQEMCRQGFWADNGKYYAGTAIVSISISVA